MMMMPEDMIGAIKIKDGLFIGDEFSAQVSDFLFRSVIILGPGICCCQQGHSYNKLCWQANRKLLGVYRNCLPYILLARLRELNSF
jgi:hypothetical protein